MKRVMTLLGIALASGMGVALAFVWLLSNLGSIEHQVAYAAELHVCLSGCPFASIQDAVDAAGTGDVIKVAAGDYTGVNVRPRNDIKSTGGVTQMVYVSKTVTILGGYTTTNWTTSDPLANTTTLDAQGRGRVLYITGNISPIIEGLRLTGGNAAGLLGTIFAYGDGGGGAYVISATATIRNSQVFGNIAGFGGGLYLRQSVTVLSRNSIISNTASLYGGGLYLSSNNAMLSPNGIIPDGSYGGGVFLDDSPATFTGNTITANTADYGGGVYLSFSPAALSGNTITANAAYYGGGVYLFFSPAALSGNTITANTADYGGGVVLFNAATLVNNVVTDNQATYQGSGLYIFGSSSPHLLHTTIARNRGGDGAGVCIVNGGSLAMTNTLLVSQTMGITVETGSNARLEGTLWGAGAWANNTNSGGYGAIVTGTANVYGDPRFVNPAMGDYHIGLGSAAIDTGVNAGVSTDIDNQPRPYKAPDLGADEYWPPGTPKYVYLPLVLKNH